MKFWFAVNRRHTINPGQALGLLLPVKFKTTAFSLKVNVSGIS